MERKKLIELAASLFIALIFISSYISLTDYNSAQATTSVPGTAYAQALSRAVITGYGSPMYLNVSCSNSSVMGATSAIVNTTLTQLETNSSILDFYSTGTNISIASQSMNTYNLYSLLKSKAGASGAECMRGYATAYIRIPQQLNITVSGGQSLSIPVPNRYLNESVYMGMNRSIGAVLYVKESMLVTQNGSIYGSMAIVPLSYDPFPSPTTSIKPATTVPATTTAVTTTTAAATTTNSTSAVTTTIKQYGTGSGVGGA